MYLINKGTQLFLFTISTIILIIAQCEIPAKCNDREILSMKHEYKKISAMSQKEFNGNNNKLGLIFSHGSDSSLAENNQNPIHIYIP